VPPSRPLTGAWRVEWVAGTEVSLADGGTPSAWNDRRVKCIARFTIGPTVVRAKGA